MIKTARQLKALVQNRTKGDSGKAQLLIRNFMMERFLERVSLSKYKDNFILKGGMLVSSMVGLDNRATMDIDTTLKNLSLNSENAREIVENIIAVSVEDNVHFQIKSISAIMEDAEYEGVRLALEAQLETMRIPMKIDLSTGDVITPSEIRYQYRLMFEDRSISVWAYTLETVLAEKMETILVRGLLNTRLRDYYDLYILQICGPQIDRKVLSEAVRATCRKRGSDPVLSEYSRILKELKESSTMQELWLNYQRKNNYAAGLSWNEVLQAASDLCTVCMEKQE
mgnify:FL=1